MRKTFILSVVLISLALLAGNALCEEYKIETGDLLLITVYGQDDLTTKVRVTKGEISFPLIGNVKAEGLTVAQLGKTVETMLEEDYLVNPKVNVVIEEYLPRKIFVLGAVEKPGAYELPANRPTTAIEAIAMAGGFSKIADQNGTKVVRKDAAGKEETIKVRAGDIVQKGRKEQDVAVQPNDVIFVPESFFKTEGFMNQPIYEQEIEINLADYLTIIRRRFWVIFTFFVIVVTTVTVATYMTVPIYKATTTMLIDEETPDVLSAKDGLSLGSPGYVSYREYYQTQLEIIKSRSIAKDVFSALALGNTPEYIDSKDPIKKFLAKLKVEPSRNTRLVYINFEDKDKDLATRIVTMISNIYAARNLVYISKNENVNLIKNEYLKLQAKYQEYTKIFKSKHPKMGQLKEEIAQMEERMKKEQDDPFKATGLKANNIRVIDPAEVPVAPVRPKKAQNILIAIIVGLIGGTGLAFLIEYLDNTVKTTDDVERYVKLPLLGYIPVIDKSFSEMQKDRLVNLMPTSPVSEAYRSIRTAIMFSGSEDKMRKDILVTSAGPREGKSLTACNLAITTAYSGNKVLLVDADMRKPRVHTVFGKDGDFGLSNFLTGQATLEDIIKKTDIENLSVITCGHIPPNPSELLSTKRMKEFLDKVREKYDNIIFDSPPLAVVTDSEILSRIIDGTVIVINSKKTTRGALNHSKGLLVKAKANVLGIILNNLRVERGHYYYYSHYYYSKDSKDGAKRERKKKT